MSYTVLLGGPQGKLPAITKALEATGVRIHLDAGGAPDLKDWGYEPEGRNHCFVTVEADDINAAYSVAPEFGWRGRAHWNNEADVSLIPPSFGGVTGELLAEVAALRMELNAMKAGQ